MALHIRGSVTPASALEAAGRIPTRNVHVTVDITIPDAVVDRLLPYLADAGLNVLVTTTPLDTRPRWIEYCSHLTVILSDQEWVPHRCNQLIYRPSELVDPIVPRGAHQVFGNLTRYLDAPKSSGPELLDFLQRSQWEWLLDGRSLSIEIKEPPHGKEATTTPGRRLPEDLSNPPSRS